MSAKSDKMYFDNLIAAANQSCLAANYLVTCLSDYNADGLENLLNTMHAYEHDGDHLKHEMSAALAKAFVTPVDREDLAVISQNIDDVTDSIEEVLQYLYMFNIKTITPDAIEFAKRIEICCLKMKEMVSEFINFKKPQKLHGEIIELSHLEEDCDRLYIQATRSLNGQFTNPMDIINWRDIYKRLETCADACEHVGDGIDMVVMKNS